MSSIFINIRWFARDFWIDDGKYIWMQSLIVVDQSHLLFLNFSLHCLLWMNKIERKKEKKKQFSFELYYRPEKHHWWYWLKSYIKKKDKNRNAVNLHNQKIQQTKLQRHLSLCPKKIVLFSKILYEIYVIFLK